MNQPLDDVTLGVIVLSIFLPGVIAVGYLIVRFQHGRHTRAWQPLLGVVGGVVQPIVGGGAESRMRGRYQGYDVVASMVPGASTGSDVRYHHFSVSIAGLPGAQDWKLAYARTLWPGDSDTRPCIEARDEGLRARLEAADVRETVEPLGLVSAPSAPLVAYSSSGRTLTLQCDAGTAWIPAESSFVAMLDALVRLARINTHANPVVR